jgi:hypothetical protein
MVTSGVLRSPLKLLKYFEYYFIDLHFFGTY